MKEEVFGLSRDEMIEDGIYLCMHDLEHNDVLPVQCTKDLDVEILVHSDGEIDRWGNNLLVLVNQPSASIKDAYMTMLHADYDDFIGENDNE